MSLRNAQEKMSKSSRSDYSRINLMDNDFLIEQKIMKSKTDALGRITDDLEGREEI
jgi:tryptophanyl-tRNA synthetase